MTTFNIESKSLTAAEARDLARSNSILQGGRYIGTDGEPPRDFPGPLPGETVFDYEPIRDRVTDGEKHSLMSRQAAGSLGGVKLRATGFAEWDHIVVAFDRDQSRQLAEAGPEAMAEVRDIITETMGEGLQNKDQRRQVFGFDLHTDRPEFHFHGLLHRFGIYNNECSKSISQDRSSEQNTLFYNINAALHERGYTFLTSTEFREQLAGYEFQPEERIEEPDPGRSIAGNARTLEPQEQKISSAISSKERRIEELKRQLEEEEQAKEELQHGLAGLVQIREANEAAEAAHAAQLAAEAQRDAAIEEAAQRVEEAAQTVEATKADAAAQIEAANTAKAEAEAISQEQTTLAESAQQRAVDLASDLEQERESSKNLADELAEVQQEVEPLRAENATLQERLERLEAQQKELADDLKASRRETMDYQQQATAALNELEAKTEFYETRDKEQVKEVTGLRHQLSELKESVAAELKALKDALTGSLNDVFAWRKREGIDDRKELGQIISQTRKPKNDNDGGGKPKP